MSKNRNRKIKFNRTKSSRQNRASRKVLREIRRQSKAPGRRKIKFRRETGKPKAFRAPRTAKELFALPRYIQEQWNRAVQIPNEMRSKKLSFEQASRKHGITRKVALRLAGSAFTKNRAGKIEAKRSDQLLRVLLIPASKGGLREIVVRGPREASKAAEYSSALDTFLSRGDPSALRKLRFKSLVDASGKRVRLLTKLDELTRLASAGVLRFDSLYGGTT